MEGLTEEQRSRIAQKTKAARLARDEMEEVSNLTEELNASNERAENLQRELFDALDALELERDNLQKAAQYGSMLVTERETLRQNLDSIKYELQEALEQQEKLRQINHGLQKDRDDMQRTVSAFMEDENEAFARQKPVSGTAKNNNADKLLLQSLEEQNEDLKHELEEMKRQIDSLKSEKLALKRKMEDNNDGSLDLQDKVDSLTDQLAEVERERVMQEEDMKNMQREMDERYELLEKKSNQLNKTLMTRFTKAEHKHNEEKEHLQTRIEELLERSRELQSEMQSQPAHGGGETLSDMLGASDTNEELEKLKKELTSKDKEMQQAADEHDRFVKGMEKTYEDKLQEAKQKEVSLAKGLSEFEAKYSGLQAEIEELTSNSNEQASRLVDLQAEKRETQNALKTASEGLENAEKVIQNLKDELNKANENTTSLRQKLESEINRIQKESATFQKSLESAKDEHEAEIRMREKRETNALKKIETLEGNKEDLKTQLESLKSDSAAQRHRMQETIDNLSHELQKKANEVEELRETARLAEEAKQRLEENKRQVEQLTEHGSKEAEAEILSLKSELESKARQVANIQDKNRDLQNKLETEKKMYQSTINKLNLELEDAQENLIAAQEEHDGVVEVLNSELEELSEEVDRITNENNTLQEEHNLLVSEHESLLEKVGKDKKTDVKTIRDLLGKLETQKGLHKTSLDRVAQLESRVAEKEKEASDLQRTVDRIAGELGNLKSEAKSRIARHGAEVESLQQSLQKAEKRVVELEELNAKKTEKYEAALTEESVIKETVKELEEEKDTLSAEVDDLLGFQSDLNAENAELQDKLAVLTREKEVSEDRVNMLEKLIEDLRNEIASMEGGVQPNEPNKQVQIERIEELEEKLVEKEDTVQELTRSNNSLTEEVDNLMGFNSELNEEIKALKDNKRLSATTSVSGFGGLQDAAQAALEKEELEESRVQLANLNKELEKKKAELDKLRERHEKDLRRLENDLMEKHESLREATEEIEEIKIENSELVTMLTETNDDKDRLLKELESKDAHKGLLGTQVSANAFEESSSEKLKDKEREVRLLEAKLGDAECDIRELRLKNQKSARILSNTQMQLEKLRREHDQLQGNGRNSQSPTSKMVPQAGTTRKLLVTSPGKLAENLPGPWWWGDTNQQLAYDALEKHSDVNGLFTILSDKNDPTNCVLLLSNDGKITENSLVSKRKGLFVLNGQNIPSQCKKLEDAVKFLSEQRKTPRFVWDTPLKCYVSRNEPTRLLRLGEEVVTNTEQEVGQESTKKTRRLSKMEGLSPDEFFSMIKNFGSSEGTAR
eukprot:m.60810 g.60810  ORF g.60810 m.60810 type:complete len:1308 (+) comp11353_c0_seq1:169-4092(+)